MTSQTSRRSFLGFSALGLAPAVAPEDLVRAGGGDVNTEAEMHWTEGGPDYADPGYLNDGCKWGGTFSDAEMVPLSHRVESGSR
jgi:hypothetical protein